MAKRAASQNLTAATSRRIKWGYPLTNGLIGCWIFSQPSRVFGAAFKSQVQGFQNLAEPSSDYGKMTVDTTQVATYPTMAHYGYVLQCDASNRRATVTTFSSTLATLSYGTIVWYGAIVGNLSGTNPSRVFCAYNSGSPYVQITSPTNDNTSVRYNWAQGLDVLTVSDVLSAADNLKYPLMLGMTGNPAYIAGYKNGIEVGRLTQAINSAGLTISTTVNIIVGTPSGVVNGNHLPQALWIWNRPLTPDEHRNLYVFPWDMFEASGGDGGGVAATMARRLGITSVGHVAAHGVRL